MKFFLMASFGIMIGALMFNIFQLSGSGNIRVSQPYQGQSRSSDSIPYWERGATKGAFQVETISLQKMWHLIFFLEQTPAYTLSDLNINKGKGACQLEHVR